MLNNLGPADIMEHLEYLVRYGLMGEFGRFRADRPLALLRGERVVVRSGRGVELGEVMRPATPRHAAYLPNTMVGRLLRVAGEEDEAAWRGCALKASDLLGRAVELARQLALPIECVDAEVLLDGEHAVLVHVRCGEGDVRELVRPLSREFAVALLLEDLTAPAEDHGCGSCGSGGCGSCGAGGCGSCGEGGETKEYFAGLREKMEQKRVNLL